MVVGRRLIVHGRQRLKRPPNHKPKQVVISVALGFCDAPTIKDRNQNLGEVPETLHLDACALSPLHCMTKSAYGL
jgi:hypothetical protein